MVRFSEKTLRIKLSFPNKRGTTKHVNWENGFQWNSVNFDLKSWESKIIREDLFGGERYSESARRTKIRLAGWLRNKLLIELPWCFISWGEHNGDLTHLSVQIKVSLSSWVHCHIAPNNVCCLKAQCRWPIMWSDNISSYSCNKTNSNKPNRHRACCFPIHQELLNI